MPIEEYINTMGPIWELQKKYRTLNDELRDAQIAMAVLSAFTLPMSLAGGAAIATGVDVASDGIDIAVDLAKGDNVGLGIDLVAMFVPEAIEGLKRVDINADKVIKNIAEQSIEGTVEAIQNALVKGSAKTWEEFLVANPGKSIEEASRTYIKIIDGQSQWPEGFDIVTHKITLEPGTEFRMVLDSDQKLYEPGGFATFDKIPDVDYARNEMAIKSNWKKDCSQLVTYRVREGVELPVIKGPVGPQIDLNADKYLSGGASQIQFAIPKGANRMDYIEVVLVEALN